MAPKTKRSSAATKPAAKRTSAAKPATKKAAATATKVNAEAGKQAAAAAEAKRQAREAQNAQQMKEVVARVVNGDEKLAAVAKDLKITSGKAAFLIMQYRVAQGEVPAITGKTDEALLKAVNAARLKADEHSSWGWLAARREHREQAGGKQARHQARGEVQRRQDLGQEDRPGKRLAADVTEEEIVDRLRPGKKIDINYPALEPFTVTIFGEPKVLEPEFVITDGELRLRRKERLIQVYTDPGGMRTLALRHITLR
jgi:hypothetical protein